jgi:hypothetical protein
MEHYFVTEVWPNLLASVIWATPAFIINHLLLRKHITRTAATQTPAPENTEVPAP